MASGLLIDAADALVAAIEAKIDDETFSADLAVEWQDDLYFELEKADEKPKVWVKGWKFRYFTDPRGITLCEFVIPVVLRRKIHPGKTQKEKYRETEKIAADLTEFVRGLGLAFDGNEAVCFEADGETANEFYNQTGVYLNEITTRWRMAWDEDDE
jgi:hypothetical protein